MFRNQRRMSPVFASLNARSIYFGAEKSFIALNVPIVVFGLIIVKTYWCLPVGVLTHMVGVWLTRRDPDMVYIYRAYRLQKSHYMTASSAYAKQGLRPEGYGRRLPA
jgi:type IV secretory pathway TrbD component